MNQRYNHLNEYYKSRFKERVLKIPIDGGFSCPNRDGSKSRNGCIFCSAKGSGDRLNSTLSIKEQIGAFLNSFKGLKANKFIAYFQSYSNTYADIATLKQKYDEAINSDSRIIGLDIATRCDCINEEVCKLLASYKDKVFVQVELGLQTSNEDTHKLVNQQITNDDFVSAMNLLNEYGIEVVVHLMVGLPGENHDDIVKTLQFLNKFKYNGIKIHSTYIEENTILNNMYQNGEYIPLTYDEYMEELVYILTHIDPSVIIHRITGDPYKPNFVAPEWTLHKKNVLNDIEKILKARNLYQGINH